MLREAGKRSASFYCEGEDLNGGARPQARWQEDRDTEMMTGDGGDARRSTHSAPLISHTSSGENQTFGRRPFVSQ